MQNDVATNYKKSELTKNDKAIRLGLEKKLREKSGSERSSIINVTSTNTLLGPGKYAEVRSSFPLYVDELLDKKMHGTTPLISKVMTDSQEESQLPDKQCNYYFKLKSNRKIPRPLKPVPPGPGSYSHRSCIDEVIERKKIGSKGKFFSSTPKIYNNEKLGTPSPDRYKRVIESFKFINSPHYYFHKGNSAAFMPKTPVGLNPNRI
jgi:hypothetical protein